MPTYGRACVQLKDPRFAEVSIRPALGPDADPAPPIIARPGASIAGRVVYESGEPAKGIPVLARGRTTGLSAATTKQDGSYVIKSLGAGSYNVNAEERSGEWIAAALQNVRTEEGQTTRVPDIVFSTGAVLVGSVVDEATGKPREGIGVYISPAGSDWMDTPVRALSDKQGKFTARIPPGRSSVRVFNPDGYGRPEDAISITVERGERKALTIKVAKAVSLSGTVVDAQGKPVPNESINIRIGESESTAKMGGRSTTDQAGKFTFRDLVEGKARIIVGRDFGPAKWELIEPKELTIPASSPVKVVVKKQQLLTLTGRTVTSDGKPVSGVSIKLDVRAPEPEHRVRFEEVTSDRGGLISLAGLNQGTRIDVKSVEKQGYKLISGGEFTGTKTTLTLSDIVLAPLGGKLSGKVVDASGAPVAGATVAALESWPDGQTKTNASGSFTLASIPEGELMVMAARGLDVGKAQARTGSSPVTITLAETKRYPGQDTRTASTVLKEAWSQSKDKGYHRRDYLALEMAPYDPDLVLEIARGEDGAVPDSVLAGTIATLAHIDPTRAAEWSKDTLDSIKDRHLGAWAALALGLALVDLNPAAASDHYSRAKNLIEPSGNDQNAPTEYGLLAALAARLGNGEAEAMVQKALDSKLQWDPVKGKAVREVPEQQAILAATVARGSAALAEGLISMLPEKAQSQALDDLVIWLARRDPAAARKTLDRIEELPERSYSEFLYGTAAPSVIAAIGKSDPEGARSIAERVKDRRYAPVALQAAAKFQSKEIALKMLREASSAGASDWNDAVEHMARSAAAAWVLDPGVGEELFTAARQKLAEDRERDRHIAAFAYHRSWADPAEARLMIEAQLAALARGGKDGWRVFDLARAMVRVDVDRAIEIARSMPEKGEYRWDVLRKIAQYLLASEAQRDDPNTRYWSDPGFGSWRPDMPASLALGVWD